MSLVRLDKLLVNRGVVRSRSQAESFIKLGKILVDGKITTKSGKLVDVSADVKLTSRNMYVSRAGLKLESVAESLGLDFSNNVVLDVGSSTGGFSDYALRHGARRIVAVDSGTNQLHPSLRSDSRIDLREQTDIRDISDLDTEINIVLVDVSFISIKQVLPHIMSLISNEAIVVAMVKPQFEVRSAKKKHKGVVKNDQIRREIFKDFELWALKANLKIINKSDSLVFGEKGNRERFYLLKKAKL